MSPALFVIAWGGGVALYLIAGVLLCLYLDGRPQTLSKPYGPFDRYGTVAQWLILVLWPVAIPVVWVRYVRAK